jgi:hypothetical protein
MELFGYRQGFWLDLYAAHGGTVFFIAKKEFKKNNNNNKSPEKQNKCFF